MKEILFLALFVVIVVWYLNRKKEPAKTKVKNIYMRNLPKNATYNDVIKYIILNFEGGYYHPDMLKDGRIKDKRYSASGETLFGIDRKAGGAINDTQAGRKFWAIVDNYNMRKNYSYNQFPNNENLFLLAGEIIKPQFETLLDRYVIDSLHKEIYKNPALLLNFVYATYNGSGWFRGFANRINQAYKNGATPEQLVTLFGVIRVNNIGIIGNKKNNSLIAQVGKKIQNINVS